MGNHRSPLQQKMEMLELLRTEDRIQTALCYKCNLNQSKGTERLAELMGKGLVARDEETGKYYLTQAGTDCLEAYAALRRLI